MNQNLGGQKGGRPHYIVALGKLMPLMSVVCLVGCEATRIGKAPDPVSSTYNRNSVMKVLAEMDKRRETVKTVITRLNVVLTDNVKGKEHGLNGAYIGDRSGNTRMQINHNDTLILDVAFRDKTVDVWLPRKNRYFRGLRKDLMQSGGKELSLLAHVGNVHDLFFPRAWTPEAVERRWNVEDGHEVIQVLERPRVFRRRVRRVVISRLQPVAEQVDVFLTNGKQIGSVIYEDYLFPQPVAGDENQALPKVVYPRRLTLTTPEGNRDMQLNTVGTILINQPIPMEKFEIPVPEDAAMKDLGEWVRSGKSIWE